VKNQTSPFETHAAEYDQWFDSERGSLIFSLELDCLRQAVDTVNGRWLEVGVGSGRFASVLGVQVGVDPSQEMVGIASERGIEAHLAPGGQLPFEDSSFDGVLLVCTICFLDDPRRTLRECWRVLNDSGRLVVGFVSCGGFPGKRAVPEVLKPSFSPLVFQKGTPLGSHARTSQRCGKL
jgi:ubiquinone/menaquinone biosynthesis C-methylase UbiE